MTVSLHRSHTQPADSGEPHASSKPLAVKEPVLSELISICPRKLAELRKRRAIPYVRIGGSIVYHLPTIDRWLEAKSLESLGTDDAESRIDDGEPRKGAESPAGDSADEKDALAGDDEW